MRIRSVETVCDELIHLEAHVRGLLEPGEVPVRFAISHIEGDKLACNLGVLDSAGGMSIPRSIFDVTRRGYKRHSSFNGVMVVPTGIGAEVGGHAGDATPAAKLLGSVCDNLVLHPNVVNASTINEMPDNALYVEGSVVSGLLMGTYGLRKVRANKVLVILDGAVERSVLEICINNLSAARAVLGVDLEYVVLDEVFTMTTDHTSLGAAVGVIEGFDKLLETVEEYGDDFDAVAIGSMIATPPGASREYMTGPGEVVNPWGGVEAMLTHALTMLTGKPCAHAPLMETMDELNEHVGLVEPRKAAEAAAADFMYCVVKGLSRAPQITSAGAKDVLTVHDIDCVVMPDHCLGLPTLACVEQDIPLILVKGNRNWMTNDLSQVGSFIYVDNYFEAAGVMAALKAGISVESLRRPIGETKCL